MKLFEKISDLFISKPKPTDIMLALEYEYEEGLIQHAPFYADNYCGSHVTGIQRKRKRKNDKEKDVPYIVFPQNLPEPVEHSFVLRNISKLETAMNIKVHPLIFTLPKDRLNTGDGRIPKWLSGNPPTPTVSQAVQVYATFSGSIISHLGPGEFVRLNIECPAVGALDRGVLPRILSWVVNASSINELFDDYTYFVNMSCESTDGRKFQIDQEIIFRPWKRKTCMGKIRRTEVTKNADL
jgi:hypothetical protein